MREIPWETIEYFNDIDEIVEVWNKMFLEVVNKHAPLKSHRIKRKYQPDWLTPQILDCIKERDKCKISGRMDEYRLLRNRVSTMIDLVKKKHIKKKLWKGKMTHVLFGDNLSNLARLKRVLRKLTTLKSK